MSLLTKSTRNLLSSSLLAITLAASPLAAAHLDCATAGLNTLRSNKEFKALKASASTAADYVALACFCRARIDETASRLATYRADLAAFYASPTGFPKYPTRDQILKTNITNAERSAAQWRAFEKEFAAKARSLGATL